MKVRLLGIYRGLCGGSLVSLELEQATVREAIQKLTSSLSPETKRLLIDPELDDPRPNALITVNRKEISTLEGLETPLQDGDELTLIPVSHGG